MNESFCCKAESSPANNKTPGWLQKDPDISRKQSEDECHVQALSIRNLELIT